MARFEFTMVSDAMMQGLFEAGATGGEIIAYQMLVRALPKDRSKAECWMPADMAEVKVGMDAHTFSKQLRSLSRKVFTTVDGEPKTVLTKVSRGCRGHCPHFEDTLGLMAARGQYPPNGDPKQTPMEGGNGDPKQAPIEKKWGPKTNQLGTQNEPIGDPAGSPIETRQDKHIIHTSTSPLPRTHDDLMAILMEGEREARERDRRERGDGNG